MGSLLLLIPLLCWLFGGDNSTSTPFNCREGLLNFENLWSQEKKDYCCAYESLGCATTIQTTVFPTSNPTQPPTPPRTTPAPSGPVDPWNCATGVEAQWPEAKK